MAADDYPGNRSTPGELGLDRPIAARIDRAGDTDWFAVLLQHDVVYTFTAAPAEGGGGPLPDPGIAVYDSDGQLLDAQGGAVKFAAADERYAFTPRKTGLYFVEVYSRSMDETGDYLLSVEAPAVTLSGAVAAEGDEGATIVLLTLSLSTPLDRPVTVTLRSVNGTAIVGEDYKAIDTPLTIPAGATAATLEVIVIGDGRAETAESFSVMLVDATGGAAIATPAATVTIGGDDPPPALFPDGGSHHGTPAGDTILASARSDEVDGGAGDDLVFGLAGADHLAGGTGGDLLLGDFPEAAGGDDSILGEAGDDVVFAGGGADTALGLDGDDTLIGEGGDDQLEGGAGFNALFGNEGADLLIGGPGEDFLFGEAGADRLDGGAGNDRVHVDGDDLLAAGGAGIFDVLVIVGAGVANVSLGSPVNQNASAEGPVLTGFEVVDASLSPVGVSVAGARLNGNGNVLIGSAQEDWLVGSHAADIIFGGQGNDTLEGLAGDDTIVADGGDDYLTGLEGRDLMRLTGAPGVVEIVDFATGEDRIEIPAAFGRTTKEILALAVAADGHAEIALAPGLLLRIVGVAPDGLSIEDFGLF